MCGEPYERHERSVSAPSEPNASEATIARSPPARAYANIRSGGASRWNPSTSTVNEVNRQRMDAAIRHRPKNSRSRTQMSQTAPQIPVPSSTDNEDYHFAVWPFAVSQPVAGITELVTELT